MSENEFSCPSCKVSLQDHLGLYGTCAALAAAEGRAAIYLEALKPFAKFRSNARMEKQSDEQVVYAFSDIDGTYEITMGMLRAARAAIRAAGEI